MEKKELIQAINQFNDIVFNLIKPNIQEIIEDYVYDSKKHEIINKEEDVRGSVGFYMIFSDCKDFTQKGCSLTYKGAQFYCVYRGQSYHVKERIQSHLFYSSNNKYPNCMEIVINQNKYHVNIGKKKLYNKSNNENAGFPDCRWLVIRIPLKNSKQAIREMFETAFDEKYGKPAFSQK